jgi:hypothetical protein
MSFVVVSGNNCVAAGRNIVYSSSNNNVVSNDPDADVVIRGISNLMNRNDLEASLASIQTALLVPNGNTAVRNKCEYICYHCYEICCSLPRVVCMSLQILCWLMVIWGVACAFIWLIGNFAFFILSN